MNRNVSIVVVVLVLVVIAGYLVWLRSKVTPVVSPKVEEQVQVAPTPATTAVASPVSERYGASPSATPKVKEATGSTKAKSATSSSTGK